MMDKLSPDCLLEVCSWLSLRDVSRLALTSKKTYQSILPHKELILLRFYRAFYGIPGIPDLDQVRSMLPYTRFDGCKECHSIEAFFAFMMDSRPGIPSAYDPIGEICLFWNVMKSPRFDPRWTQGEFDQDRWVIDVVIEHNDLIGLQWYLDNVDPTGNHLMGYALQCNQLDLVMWLHERGLSKGLEDDDFFCHCNEYGDIPTIAFMREHYYSQQKDVMDIAFAYCARGGHFEAVEWLNPSILEARDSTGDDYTFEAIDGAAEHGQLHIVMWLYWQGYDASDWAVDEAARNGHHEVVVFLTHHFIHGTMRATHLTQETAADQAACSGNIELFRHLLKLGYQITSASMEYAAKYGYMKILEEIDALLNPRSDPRYDDSTPGLPRVTLCTEKAVLGAASRGQLEALRYLEEKGHLHGVDRQDTDPLDAAARNGHLDVVRWLLAHGFMASSDAIDQAAKYGYFFVVQVLSIAGCSCTQKAMTYASACGQVEMMEFLHSWHGLSRFTTTVIFEAIRAGRTAVMEYLAVSSEQPLPHEWIRRFAIFCGFHDIVRIANGIEYGQRRRGLTEKDQATIEFC